MIVIGNWMLLNLFVAILINFISYNLDEEEANQNDDENEDIIE